MFLMLCKEEMLISTVCLAKSSMSSVATDVSSKVSPLGRLCGRDLARQSRLFES